MTLFEIARRGAPFAYRYGAERELWIANLEKKEKAIASANLHDDRGDPLMHREPFDPEDFQYADWSIMPETDEQ